MFFRDFGARLGKESVKKIPKEGSDVDATYQVSKHVFSLGRFLYTENYIQVVPGRAGGGSFRRKKNYIAKKEFAYRMCARRPTSAMPKPFLCCERAFCCSMVVM